MFSTCPHTDLQTPNTLCLVKILYWLSECPVKVLKGSPLDTLHTPIVVSADPEAKYSPFGEKATLKIEAECPSRVFSTPSYSYSLIPRFSGQILSVRRKCYLTLMSFQGFMCFPLDILQIVLSPEAKYSPFGENETLCTQEE